jgi:hypothetical protein
VLLTKRYNMFLGIDCMCKFTALAQQFLLRPLRARFVFLWLVLGLFLSFAVSSVSKLCVYGRKGSAYGTFVAQSYSGFSSSLPLHDL